MSIHSVQADALQSRWFRRKTEVLIDPYSIEFPKLRALKEVSLDAAGLGCFWHLETGPCKRAVFQGFSWNESASAALQLWPLEYLGSVFPRFWHLKTLEPCDT